MKHRAPAARGVGRLIVLTLSLSLLGVQCTATPKTIPSPLPGGVYRSDDGGSTFVQRVRQADLEGTLVGIRARQFVLPPQRAHTAYIVAEEGLFASFNAGNTWQRLPFPATRMLALTVHPRNREILLASVISEAAETEGKILKSVDGGETWADIFTAPAAEEETGTIVRRRRAVANVITDLSHDPHAPEVIWAATNTGALLVSADGGIHWETRRTVRQGVTALKLSPLTRDLLFLRLADGRLARSADGGKTVEPVRFDRRPGEDGTIGIPSFDLGTANEPVNALQFVQNRAGAEAVWVGTSAALYRSDDRGQTWTVVAFPSASGRADIPISSISSSPDGTIWVASGSVLFSSKNDGATWRAHDTPLRADIRLVGADPRHTERVYLIFQPK